MPNIPDIINNVTVEFASTVNKSVKQRVIDGLNHCIREKIAPDHTLTKIYVSSANDSHTLPSRHMQQKAVDISRINGDKISVFYGSSNSLTAIVNAIQDTFESYEYCRENFGPHLKKKNGNNWSVSGHGDHIHLSVD
jgi:hypothetical protein